MISNSLENFGFKSLNKDEKAIIKFMAILNQPITIKNLQRFYQKAARMESGAAPHIKNPAQFKLHIESIKKRKFADHDLLINQTIANSILQLFSKEEAIIFSEAFLEFFEFSKKEFRYSDSEAHNFAALRFFLWSKNQKEIENLIGIDPDFQSSINLIKTLCNLFQPPVWPLNPACSVDDLKSISRLSKVPLRYFTEIDQDFGTYIKNAILIAAASGEVQIDDFVISIAENNLKMQNTKVPIDAPLFVLLNAGRLPKENKENQGPIEAAFYYLAKGDAHSSLKAFKKHRLEFLKGDSRGQYTPLPGIVGLLICYLEIILNPKTSTKICNAIASGSSHFNHNHSGSDFVSDIANQICSEGFYYQMTCNEHNPPVIASGLTAINGLGLAISMQRFFAESKSLSDSRKYSTTRKLLTHFTKTAKSQNFNWLARELIQCGRNLGLDKNDFAEPEKPQSTIACLPSNSLPEIWEKNLQKIKDLVGFEEQENGLSQKNKKSFVLAKKISWFIDESLQNITPKLQLQRKNGAWSVGKAISLRTIVDSGLPDCATDIDRKLIQNIKVTDNGWYGGSSYSLSTTHVVSDLANHPNIYFQKDPDQKITFQKFKPELLLGRNKNIITIGVSDKINYLYKFQPCRDKNLYGQINILGPLTKIAEKLIANFATESLEFPIEKINKFYPVIRSIQKVIAIAGVEKIETEFLKKTNANTVLNCRLTVDGEVIHINVLADPFSQMPKSENPEFEQGKKVTKNKTAENDPSRPVFQPGEGDLRPIFSLNGNPCCCERNFKTELQNWELIKESIAKIFDMEKEKVKDSFSLDIVTEQTLEFLEEIKTLEDANIIQIEWADENKKIKTSRVSKAIKIDIDSSSTKVDWFQVSGSLQIDKSKVIQFEAIIEELLKSGSRFIKMDDNNFLALTKEIATQLRVLGRIQKSNKDANLPAAAILSLQKLMDSSEVEVRCSDLWKEKIESFDPSKIKLKKLPKSFNATLRPYQTEGFNWLQKMGQFGFGACLADDMGLGKTVQCLALAAIRKTLGPTLVIAPTSLTFNWKLEVEKFCPSLKPILLSGDDRLSKLKHAKAGEIYFTSYGQLVRDLDQLTQISWSTLILDECQSIKNPQTQRAKAARKLKANFRIGLSGTPIENHLGELWSLFHFLNPGLLGDLKGFKEQYTGKGAEKEALQSLNQMISPFLLRRIKKNVLKDLPAKIEKTLIIPQNKNEMAFYEALRLKLLEKLEKMEPNRRYLESLAALTKLRRAACHPILVDPGTEISSAKHEALHALLRDIVSNGHQVLIFSQFVGHLKIVKEHLEENEISYQYLDGKTPLKKRAESVAAFQKGEGRVFLISLKAGGFGLNLTAADHVIHLDPWWNPAVEDQASDRSHRIGQVRSVNIYRMVTKDSIEEKILSLHGKKRNLADQILSDKAKASSFSGNELFALLAGN